MNRYETLLLEVNGPIVTVTINRPAKLNALNGLVLQELSACWVALEEDEAVRVAILTGAGKAFVAGADISEMTQMTAAEARDFAAMGQRLGQQMERARLPIIAAVNGHALGGGTELALCCDFIYAAEGARFGQPEVTLGLMPGFGGTQRLARHVGLAKARELVFTGSIIDSEVALALGLINQRVSLGELLPRVREVALGIARQAPLAVAACKRVMTAGYGANLAVGLELEASAFAALFASEDQKEGTSAFFEKRSPEFKGR